MTSVFLIMCIGSGFWLICVLVANIRVVRCIRNTIIKINNVTYKVKQIWSASFGPNIIFQVLIAPKHGTNLRQITSTHIYQSLIQCGALNRIMHAINGTIVALITPYIRILDFDWLIYPVYLSCIFIFRINFVHVYRCWSICMKI